MRGASAWLGLVVAGLTGCATMDSESPLADVSASIYERSAMKIAWRGETTEDEAAAVQIRALLRKKLTADDAVQIAALNNRELRAVYAALGLAQADLIQAGLFKNPLIDAAVFFPLTGVRPDFQLNVVVGFLDALYVPLRKRVAAAVFEEAKLTVTGVVLDFAADVRAAFYAHQADEQVVELRQTIVGALTASLDVSRRLHEAGNITALDLARDRAQTEEAKIALRTAEVAARQSREQLNILMGAWGEDTDWSIEPRLPQIPDAVEADEVERIALERSVDVLVARQRIVAAGQQLGYTRATAFVPDLEVGAGAEREGDEPWKVGPAIAFPIPLFDRGQARVRRAAAELQRAEHEYHALGVRIRATARAVHDRVVGARDRALYYRDILLPLRERIVDDSQLYYNAMQIGIAQLLREREQQIATAVAYVDMLREYWLAQTDLLRIVSGRVPAAKSAQASGHGRPPTTSGRDGH